MKSIILNYWVTIIKFSKDSKILFSGDREGYLNCYDMNNSILINKEKVNSSSINDMITLD